MNTDLLEVAQLLENAHKPEDVFGTLDGNPAEALRAAYRRLTKIAHPDRYLDTQDQAMAEHVFRALQKWLESAEEKIAAGIYEQQHGAGSAPAPTLVRTGKHAYLVHAAPFAQGDLCNLYHCTYTVAATEAAVIFKVARHPDDDDLVANEAAVLKTLAASQQYQQFHAYIPQLLDSFYYEHPSSPASRRANVLGFEQGPYVSLPDIRAYYYQGIDPKHMAWIWRRMLIALSFAHSCDIIHGAMLPTHVLIQPEQHGVVLLDWSYAVSNPAKGAYISAIAAEYQDWYPQEVLSKQSPSPSTDLFMGARCMIYLLGGDPITGAMPLSVPERIVTFFRGMLRPKPAQRPQNALTVLDEFTEVIERLWGPRRFSEFYMPKQEHK